KVYAIDVATKSVLTIINAGQRSNGVAVHPSGQFVYVSNGGGANVVVIDVATLKVVDKITVGQRPWNMAITPDGKKLYVANG
ncbi:beta-propeller fold lactonase family protein, partial [Acinetobacter baumannii]